MSKKVCNQRFFLPYRDGTPSICGSLFPPGRAAVQIPHAEGAGSVPAGPVRSSPRVPVQRGGQTFAELQQGAAASHQISDVVPPQPSA